MANHYVCGVNWSTLKKIAYFVFGKENIIMDKIIDDKHFNFYVDKTYYYEHKALIEKFEDTWKVNIKMLG